MPIDPTRLAIDLGRKTSQDIMDLLKKNQELCEAAGLNSRASFASSIFGLYLAESAVKKACSRYKDIEELLHDFEEAIRL